MSCIGSGYCCWKAPCMLAQRVHGPVSGPCPSLVFDKGRHWCGEVLKADEDDKLKIIDNLAIGAGCCSSLNSWRREPIRDRTKWKANDY